ncbi:MAG: alkylhydroperoxidase-related (seleno)protein [Acidobacteriota bacterium]|nr:alkylhydroperoxidase-related (seleno)protein [Acidobacteriota bacterium]
MSHFAEHRFPYPIREDLLSALRKSWADLGRAGTWWPGAERLAIATVAREQRVQRSQAPWARAATTGLGAELPEAAIQAASRIAADPHNLDRAWAEEMTAELGDTHYVEIASIVVTVAAVDAFCEAFGVDHEPLPDPQPGEPSGQRPDGMGDIGAWVPAIVEYPGPNVARAMSLVPEGVKTFFRLVSVMYSSADFDKMVWAHRPLSRPQVELLAARVSAVNECFY